MSDQLRWFTKRGGERVLQYRLNHHWLDVPEEAEDEPQRNEDGDEEQDKGPD